ncbi:MAG TPA: hypothetical protein DCM40_40475, partial [Maribacter sp.]|nr:hypothetical protein [Maribacter sp.]
NLAGQATEMPDTGKEAFRKIISDEAKILKEPITLALNLKWSANSWNEFLTKVIFGEYTIVTKQPSRPSQDPFPILYNFENSKSFEDRTDTILQYGGASYVFVKNFELNNDGNYTYVYSLVYIDKYSVYTQIEDWTSDYII